MGNHIEWAAGLYDGEGSCYLDRNTNGYKLPTISIGMANKEALVKFKEVFGVGHINGPFDRGPKKKPIYTYRCRKINDILDIIHVMYPHLTKEKQEQIDLVMSAYFDGDWWF